MTDEDLPPQPPEFMRLLNHQLAAVLPTTELHTANVYQHWEDRELNFAPLKYRCWFLATLSPMIVSLETEWVRYGDKPSSLRAALQTRSRDETPAWVIVQDARFRNALGQFGFQRVGGYVATWALTHHDVSNVVSDVVEVLVRLSKLEVEVLRREELPADVAWPGSDTVEDLVAAERIDVEGGETNGMLRISVHIGERTSVRLVAPDTMRFIAWWQRPRDQRQAPPRSEEHER